MRIILIYMTAYRRTPQRELILRTVKMSPQFLTAEQVFKTVKKFDHGIGVATVYRNLEALTDRGTITAFEGDDGVRRFVGSSLHVASFRCQRCGKERVLPSQSLPQYVNRKMFGAQTVFFSRLSAQGICASCMRSLKRGKVRA